MVTKTKPTVAPPPKKVDWLPPIGITLGVIGVGIGLWLLLSKKAFAAGDKIDCLFKYTHAGPGGNFIFRVIMGHIIEIPLLPIFNEMPETRQEFIKAIAPTATFQAKQTMVTYQVPQVLAKDKYDVEASIRWPDGSIVSGMRVIANDIIVVE